MKLLQKIPVPICGLALGLAALGNLLLPYGAALRYICGALSLLVLLALTLKAILNFGGVKKELENPVVFSVLPTYTMAWMLLAAYLKPFAPLPALVLWYAALVLQFVIIALFCARFVLHFNLNKVFPSWFITFVGFVVASVTAPAMGTTALGQVLFYIGFVLYLVLLPLVVYRLTMVAQYPKPALPTLAIFCAPIGLCLAGYLAAFEQKNTVLLYVLLVMAAASYLFVLTQLPALLRLPFFPSYSSFTFPLVICAIGFNRAGALLAGGPLFTALAFVSTLVAVAAVLYVLVRYCLFLFAPQKQAQP
ncbi:MAG: TDT family transporter [Oscillospiraceae bacterium]